MSFKLPETGIVFWPVGTGDSTTICIDKDTIIQVDFNHLEKSDEEKDPHWQILDELIKVLPKKEEKPFLSAFILTHPDQDHCRGFKELLSKVTIGELWHTPRVFREFKEETEQCEDAKAFRKEASRRTKLMIKNKGKVSNGNRLRLVGYDDLLKEDKYKDFPKDAFSVPGNSVSIINGTDCSKNFSVFIQAPFKDDSAGERNETSLAFQLTLKNDSKDLKALLLGDLSYPTLRRIFDYDIKNINWDVFLAPHHCSKSVMYQKNDKDEDELKKDILDDIKKAGGDFGYIISSSEPIPASNESGDNPPHAKAKKRYEEIVPNDFLCTMEYPNTKKPKPIIFSSGKDGIDINNEGDNTKKVSTLAASIKAARGKNEPPSTRTGFGTRYE